jgi:MIP family channel proteins
VHTVVANGVTTGSFSFGTLFIAAAFGFSIFVLVSVLAPVSGGHLNPAVTAGLVSVGKCSMVRGGLYAVAQILGAALGAGLVRAGMTDVLEHVNSEHNGYVYAGGGLNNVVSEQLAVGFIGEVMCTALLVFTVMSATDHRAAVGAVHLPTTGPLMIGMAVLLGHLVLVPVTGCSINPARSMGTAIVGGDIEVPGSNDPTDPDMGSPWRYMWLFWVAPILGGVLAAQLYWWVFTEPAEKSEEKERIHRLEDFA